MSDTPDTDQKAVPHIGFYSCATVPAEFARKLERERDEAREELHDIRLNLGADAEGYTMIHAVCVLQQERDEAREALTSQELVIAQHKVITDLMIERNEARQSTLRLDAINFKLKKELDDAKQKIKNQADRLCILEGATNHAEGTPLSIALKERDEAREEAQKSKAYKRVLKVTNENLKRERDEARKEAHRFRSLHYSHLGINGSASAFAWEGK